MGTLAAILAIWSALEVARISKGQDGQDEYEPASAEGSRVDATRTPVEAGARH